MLQILDSDHLPILLYVPLSPVFCPNVRPPSFNFQKACWDDFVSYFDTHCPSAEEYSFLSLSSAAALLTSLALNAAKSSISFGRIKCPPKAWWSAEVEGAVSERCKPFADAHRSDEDRQTYISASRCHQSLPRPRQRHGRQLALFFHSNQTLNLYTLFFAVSLALLPRLPSHLISQMFLSQGIGFGLCCLPEISLFRFLTKALHSRARGYLSVLC